MKIIVSIFCLILIFSPLSAKEKGVLYLKKINGKFGWYKEGNEKKDWKFAGEIKKGKPNGLGIITSPFGKYVGRVKNGLMHGKGTFTYKSGRKRVGEFRMGRPWNVKAYDKSGKVKANWINGKKVKQIKNNPIKNKNVSKEKKFDFSVRAVLGNMLGKIRVSSGSLLLIFEKYGLGFNQLLVKSNSFAFKSDSSGNNNYKLTNSSVDLSYTFDFLSFTAGMGYVYEGKGVISNGDSDTNLETENVSGYGLFGIFGGEWFGLETLFGARFDKADYLDFKSTKTTNVVTVNNGLSISTIQLLLGLGYKF